jgi:Ankyrin repeats (3 copies)
MPTHPEESRRPESHPEPHPEPSPLRLTLPDRPNLRHLKDQAKDLLRAGNAASLTDAQFRIARLYGFESWPKLKAHVDLLTETGQLKQAIDTNNLEEVKRLMTRNPALHRAPLGYGKNGPLTWVAECRVPWEPPTPVRLEMAQWMIDSGSDLHQGGDGPLMRAALRGDRIPMMELLVRNGADVNAQWSGFFPIIFAPCESVQPAAIKWLLDHGADPDCAEPGRKYPDNALDYVIGTYSRSHELAECIDMLAEAGCVSRHKVPGLLELLSGRIDRLAELLDADPSLAQRRFPELDIGGTAYRRMKLNGGTLLHVAAEYGNVEAARLLLDHGADVNARAEIDANGVGGQTPIFHAASQFYDYGLSMVEFLVAHGADLTVRARIPGHYEREDEFVECNAVEYAQLFPGAENKTVSFLRGVLSNG